MLKTAAFPAFPGRFRERSFRFQVFGLFAVGGLPAFGGRMPTLFESSVTLSDYSNRYPSKGCSSSLECYIPDICSNCHIK